MNLVLVPITLKEEKTNPDYSSGDCQHVLRMWEAYYPKIGYHIPWIGYFIKLDERIAGSCGFTGPPLDNRVEVSYWTFKEFEGRGISTRACRELVSIAKKTDSTLQVIAKTAPEKNASTTILERCGFEYSRVVQDHEIGDAWEWVFNRE